MAKADPRPSGPARSGTPSPGAASDARRSFLVKLAATVAGAVAALTPLLGGLVMGLDPLRRKAKPTDFMRLAALDELPENGEPLGVRVIADRADAWSLQKNQPVGRVFLRRVRDAAGQWQVTALSAECPHAGCFVSFARGEAAGEEGKFLCPCHNSAFRISGEMIQPTPSPRDMDALECQVRASDAGREEVWVKFQTFYAGKAKKIPKT
jgi:Rieske Fe-S protein